MVDTLSVPITDVSVLVLTHAPTSAARGVPVVPDSVSVTRAIREMTVLKHIERNKDIILMEFI
jgi:hypothetical protein